MAIPVRSARFDSDEQELTDVLQMNLPYRQHTLFFQWLYRDNPAGEARAWVATDPDTNRIVGAAAAFPRLMSCGSDEALGYVLGDFCIQPQYRSLGHALALQRACLDGLSASSPVFIFDFPSQSMLAIYKRLGIEVNIEMARHAKLLRADHKIAERVPVSAVARGLSSVVNIGLRLWERSRKQIGPQTIAVEEGPWGEEFTRAAKKWSPAAGVCVLRTADYLNWRYRKHPTQSYELLAARHGEALRGFLILHLAGENCVIDDLLAQDDQVCQALLAEAVALARQWGVHTLSVPWLSTHPGRHLLKQCGFRPRESHPVVLLPANSDWYLTSGDWEG